MCNTTKGNGGSKGITEGEGAREEGRKARREGGREQLPHHAPQEKRQKVGREKKLFFSEQPNKISLIIDNPRVECYRTQTL